MLTSTLAPARELYGAMLLDRAVPALALAAFEATLKKEPNRLAAILGAARAAEMKGDLAKAKDYYVTALALADAAAPGRESLQQARAFASRN